MAVTTNNVFFNMPKKKIIKLSVLVFIIKEKLKKMDIVTAFYS